MRVAGIDCGTNSVRLLIAEVAEPGLADGLTDVVRRMEIVRLGEGVDRTGRLSPEAIERTRVALADYAEQIRASGVERARMVATSASRDAENAAEFTAMVRATLGVEPEVVTGDEEARLSYAGATAGLPAGTAPPYLVADIGGGSTELITGGTGGGPGGGTEIDTARSVDIGCVRMTERHLHSDPPTPEEIAAAEADIRAAIREGLTGTGTLIGLAGSVTTVAGIALGLDSYDSARIHHAVVTYEDVAKVSADLLAATSAERLAIGVMHPGRADVIGAGALILRILMEEAGAESVLASEHDILDGIVLTLPRW